MTDFQFNHQQYIDQDYQGINITKFVFSGVHNLSEEQILANFLLSPKYSFESLREVVKQNPQEGYLQQAFEPSQISVHDFRKASKAQAIKFLQELEDDNDWGDTDKDDFISIKNQFLSLLNPVKTDCFFIISKDWFSKGDPKVREPLDWIYIYYYLLIWIDKIEATLTISEWTYD